MPGRHRHCKSRQQRLPRASANPPGRSHGDRPIGRPHRHPCRRPQAMLPRIRKACRSLRRKGRRRLRPLHGPAFTSVPVLAAAPASPERKLGRSGAAVGRDRDKARGRCPQVSSSAQATKPFSEPDEGVRKQTSAINERHQQTGFGHVGIHPRSVLRPVLPELSFRPGEAPASLDLRFENSHGGRASRRRNPCGSH
jgi:hypothetical protein